MALTPGNQLQGLLKERPGVIEELMAETHPTRIVIIEKECGLKEIHFLLWNRFLPVEGGVDPFGIP